MDRPLSEGDIYEVTTYRPQVTAEALRNIPFFNTLEGGRYTDVPDDLDERIRAIALDWTGDADNVFDKVVAIEERLHGSGEFGYQVDTQLRSGSSSILEFLTETRAGFCQQFATSMAAMLRTIGIQSRVVVGYATGLPIAPGEYSFSTDVAHAWVEVWFPGWGWMPFEPTPTRTNAVTYVSAGEAPCPGQDCAGETPPRGTGGSATEGREAGAIEGLGPGTVLAEPPAIPARSTSPTMPHRSARGWRSSSARSSSGSCSCSCRRHGPSDGGSVCGAPGTSRDG